MKAQLTIEYLFLFLFSILFFIVFYLFFINYMSQLKRISFMNLSKSEELVRCFDLLATINIVSYDLSAYGKIKMVDTNKTMVYIDDRLVSSLYTADRYEVC